MTDPKPLPTLEYSLKSISWHLKTIADAVVAMREILEKKGF
jgi:hypothetical protein